MRTDIAIIGMACTFPGAATRDVFWTNLTQGRTEFREVPGDRWPAPAFFNAHARAVDKTYSTRMAALDDIRGFAPAFFGITPKRARVMDPQQRLLLECARVAVEDAGYARRPLPAPATGVYVGVSVSEHKDLVTSRIHVPQAIEGAYGEAAAGPAAPLIDRVPAFHAYTMVGQLLNMCAANISHAFDFGGPSLAVDTACSSSLVALYEAMLHLRAGVIDAAVVGGVYVNLDPVSHVCFSRIGALSRAGVCAPFSADADGFVLGEGVGVVVLKRADDAARDGDRPWAVINGAAVNNDARSEGPMTPSRAGQVAVMERAYRDAGVSPADVSLIEAHGTGTAAGDRTEIDALGELYRTHGSPRPRALTSVKANIGHTLAASGMASLIRTALALRHGVVPRQAGFARPRPDLDFAGAGLQVPTETRPWDDERRRAGISSFGFGGTNAHVVLSAPVPGPRAPRVTVGGRPAARVPFVISAPTATHLDTYRQRLADAVAALPDGTPLADIAFTAATRRDGPVRFSTSAETPAELAAHLRAGDAEADSAPVAFDDCRVVALPPSPLETRPYWVVEDRDMTDAGNAPAAPDPEVTPIVLDAIARVSAFPIEQLGLDQALGDQLGFDSLMTADLVSELATEWPGLDGQSPQWFDRSLTIGGLIARLSSVIRTASPAGAVQDETARPAAVHWSLATHPWLADHAIDGAVVVPLAAIVDLCLQRLRQDGAADPIRLDDLIVHRGVSLSQEGGVWLRVTIAETTRVEVECAPAAEGPWVRAYSATAAGAAGAEPPLERDEVLTPATLTVADFYEHHAFHGVSMRSLQGAPRWSARHVSAVVRDPAAGGAGAVTVFDGALQAAAFWAAAKLGAMALPTAVRRVTVAKPIDARATYTCFGTLESQEGRSVMASLDLVDATGELVVQMRGLEARLMDRAERRPADAPEAAWRIDMFPEVRALQQRRAATAAAGLRLPYFSSSDGIARDTARVDGREMISYSTYNYLGLSGDPDVTAAAVAAVERYGTTVSASRIAAGERPVHRELELALARFLGCEDAIAFVGGHATNVTTIGHLVGPQDLVLYDALAHDSIIGGARLSGARHRSFPHNDMAALDRLLERLRPSARRVLVCVEGVYSMDGDLAPLDRLLAIKRRHRALLLVDEAHSLGVLGATGRGAGEHFGVDRNDVDVWMGTLSKALASCGGYVAGSAALVEYLKYSAPGFVYTCGLSPANAAAALAAVHAIDAQPGLVSRLRERAELFRRLLRSAGLDGGASEQSAVIPCIVGRSDVSLRLSAALADRGIAVHPIIYPAVEEPQARLRFFVSALHSESQIRGTVQILAEEMAAIERPVARPIGMAAPCAS